MGHSYAVLPPRGAAVCRVVVHEVDLQRAGDLTFDNARREGHRTRDEWKAAWVRRYDRSWCERQDAWASEDELLSEDQLVERFEARHADREVWAVFFELDRSHQPRYLHRQSERGYTTNPHDAVPDEPEAVDAATQVRISAEAHERDPVRPGLPGPAATRPRAHAGGQGARAGAAWRAWRHDAHQRRPAGDPPARAGGGSQAQRRP